VYGRQRAAGFGIALAQAACRDSAVVLAVKLEVTQESGLAGEMRFEAHDLFMPEELTPLKAAHLTH